MYPDLGAPLKTSDIKAKRKDYHLPILPSASLAPASSSLKESLDEGCHLINSPIMVNLLPERDNAIPGQGFASDL